MRAEFAGFFVVYIFSEILYGKNEECLHKNKPCPLLIIKSVENPIKRYLLTSLSLKGGQVVMEICLSCFYHFSFIGQYRLLKLQLVVV